MSSPTSAPGAPLRLAGCIILDAAGRILLLHRNTARHTHWEVPGGKIEGGELAASAAAREIREELGVTVVIGPFLGSQAFTEDGQQMTYTWFHARIIRGVPRVQETDRHDAYAYFSADQMQVMRSELSSAARHFLDQLQEGTIVL